MVIALKSAIETTYRPTRILSIDGSDIYRAMNRVDGSCGLSVKDQKGKLDTSRFRGFLDSSLDTDQMKRLYAKHKELPGSFRVCKEYTLAVVNVTFDYSVKPYYNRGKHLFVKDGYEASWEDLEDHVCIAEEDGKDILIAIEVAKDGADDKEYTPIDQPISDELLGDFFAYDASKKQYRVIRKKNASGNDTSETLLPAKQNKKTIRKWLYTNGFDIDGVHYVRYKRSAGSSRDGHCLFIAEALYDDMMQWSSCGLDPEKVKDQASWQAYISLTLSSIEKKIHIPKQSILLIKDQISRFEETVVRVTENSTGLDARKERAKIENVIWDGEALLDRSVFCENGYADKGMMLLRNRFFKTCAFNTNLQQWFSDNHITKLSQLNGYHSRSAKSIENIKLVITESSLKYLKFKPDDIDIGDWFQKWLDTALADKEQSMFGVVKTDKPSGPMGNKLVRTNYQLLNTLALSKEDAARILANSLEFLHGIQKDPMFLRYHANLFVSDSPDVDDDSATSENYRQRLISDIMRKTDDFEGTVFYRNYRAELCRSFKERLKHGRVLIDGGYHTLLGNGLEFLHAIIDKTYIVDEPLALCDGEIYTQKFPDGKMLLCERSPHITMGNLLVAKNKYVPEIERYFNLGSSKAIVCVNAIKSNLQQRLNGCDYDSDAMLITDEPTLLQAAVKNYERFPVPFCDVFPGGKRAYSTSPADLAELDVHIFENCIGEIVNLSQFLNSLYWDRENHGTSEHDLESLYCDICKLAVLSGMEIDKAKRLYPVSASEVLQKLRQYKNAYKAEHNGKVPEFFTYITESESDDASSPDATLDTAMSFVYNAVENDSGRSPRSKNTAYIDLFKLDFEKGDPTGAYAKRRDGILQFIEESQKEIRRLNFISNRENRFEKLLAMEEAEALFDQCKEKMTKSADDHIYYLLLRELDKQEETKKGVTRFHSLLFAVMCYANEGYLFGKLLPPKSEMFDLLPVDDATIFEEQSEKLIFLYGHPHKMGRWRK